MKTTIARTVLLALAAAPSVLLAQGPLLPPTAADDAVGPNPPLVGGNPSPTMKTLHQLEPRELLLHLLVARHAGAPLVAGRSRVGLPVGDVEDLHQ